LEAIAPGVEWDVINEDMALAFRFLPDSESIESDDIVRALKTAGIKAEINRDVVQQAIDQPSENWTVIAEGAEATPSKDGYLEYFVDQAILEQKPVIDEADNVDHKNLALFVNVKEGDQLVRKHDPVLGEAGVDVYGKSIPPPDAETVELPSGEGVSVEEDGHLAIAGIEGAVTFIGNRLCVMDVYTVSGEVSYKTGNIDFDGIVNISGDVLSGFEVKAKGDIVVRGMVEAAVLECGGDVQITGGFAGQGRGRIKAGGNVTIGYATEGTIEAGQNVVCKTHILHCDVNAQEEIETDGGKGVIAGGVVTAGKRIKSASFGTEAGVKTVVRFGFDYELSDKIDEAEEKLSQLLKDKVDCEGHQAELNKMRSQIKEAQKGLLVAEKNIFPGVTILFPGAKHEIMDGVGGRIFACIDGEIKAEGGDIKAEEDPEESK